MKNRIWICGGIMLVFAMMIIIKTANVINDETVISAGMGRGYYTVTVERQRGSIYDRNMLPLTNRGEEHYALINPDTFSVEEVYPYISDHNIYKENISGSAPFLCPVETDMINDPLTPVITCKKHYSENGFAAHIIGYSDENYGSCGLEGVYSDYLNKYKAATEVTYSVNARGNVLDGAAVDIKNTGNADHGVITTIDRNIQQICEKAMDKIKCGAAVVMDVETGDILASVSRPVYDINSLGDYMDDADSPFINRVFYPYSVGSVFKLTVAAAALEAGISEDFSCECTGKTLIGSQEFKCHHWAGHGKINMRTAVAESCNPYFIQLGRNIPNDYYVELLNKAGFGRESSPGGLYCMPGYLPTAEELSVPAEKANICFGQGKLSAAPLQVCGFIAAVANGGTVYEPRLVYGTTDGITEREATGERIISEVTAAKLRSFMRDTLYKDDCMGIPDNTDGGCKTSTAQTGRFDENGTEILNCWFAGFFPYIDPEYAVVVFNEDGISGNISCGGVFKEIAEEITEYERMKD